MKKCIEMSTNKPSIGAVVLETAPLDFEKNSFKFQLFLEHKSVARVQIINHSFRISPDGESH